MGTDPDIECGENIYFYVDGNPRTPWCNEIAEYFLRVFAEYGETSVLLPRKSVEIIRFEVGYFDGIVSNEYTIALSANDEEDLLKIKYEYEADESPAEEYIDVPENYYIKFERLLEELKGYDLINRSVPDSYRWKAPGVKSFIC